MTTCGLRCTESSTNWDGSATAFRFSSHPTSTPRFGFNFVNMTSKRRISCLKIHAYLFVCWGVGRGVLSVVARRIEEMILRARRRDHRSPSGICIAIALRVACWSVVRRREGARPVIQFNCFHSATKPKKSNILLIYCTIYALLLAYCVPHELRFQLTPKSCLNIKMCPFQWAECFFFPLARTSPLLLGGMSAAILLGRRSAQVPAHN